MDPNTLSVIQGAAGAGGGGDPVYVEDVFNTTAFTANGSTGQSFTTGLDLDGEGGMVWHKDRDQTYAHSIWDTERGRSSVLKSSDSAIEASYSNSITFNSDGHSVTGAQGNEGTNATVAWSFRKAPGFFDVVKYTGDDDNDRTIPHSLGCKPGMILTKNLSDTYSWSCYHKTTGIEVSTILNSDGDAQSPDSDRYPVLPTDEVWSPGSKAQLNTTGDEYIAYLFADGDEADAQIFGDDGDESIVKCGTYTSDGSTQVINLGWEPQWLIVKRHDGTGSWYMMDTMRGFTAGDDDGIAVAPVTLKANSADAEGGISKYKITSTGFDWQSDSGDNGEEYIYIAIRRGPMKTPEDATEVFAIDYGNSSSTIPCWDSGFPVDLAFWTYPGSGYAKQALSRLTDTKYLYANDTDDEANDPDLTWDSNAGWGKSWNTSTISWMFRRAPGFCDVVAYDGTGSTKTESHNLGVVPEMMFVKCRNSAENWIVYHSALGGTKRMILNSSTDVAASILYWNNTDPTSTVFTVYGYDGVNGSSKTYVNYLFATCPGVSKVGSYAGTGSDINVDCGFTSGARFVLIKRTNSTADWFLYDTTRGIVSGNDPYLKLNEDETEVTTTDYIDPLDAGFIANATSADINTSGGEYIYLAIA